MARRDEWLRRAAQRDHPPPAGRRAAWRRRGFAALVGWLVLMTIWGIGRSGFPEHVGWFLAAGFAGAVATTVTLWRR